MAAAAAADRWGREPFRFDDGSNTKPVKSMNLDTIQGWCIGNKDPASANRRPTSAQTSSRPARDLLRTSDIEKAAPTPQTRCVSYTPAPPPPQRPATAAADRGAAAVVPQPAAAALSVLNHEVADVYKYSSMHHPQWRLNSADGTFRSQHNPLTPHYPAQKHVAAHEQGGEDGRARPLMDSTHVRQCMTGPSAHPAGCSPTRKRVPARAWGVYSIKLLAADEIAVRAGWVGAVETDQLPPQTPKIRTGYGQENHQSQHNSRRHFAAAAAKGTTSTAASERRGNMRWFNEVHSARVASYQASLSAAQTDGPAAVSVAPASPRERPSSARTTISVASTAQVSEPATTTAPRPTEALQKLTDLFVCNVHKRATAGGRADAFFAMLALERSGKT